MCLAADLKIHAGYIPRRKGRMELTATHAEEKYAHPPHQRRGMNVFTNPRLKFPGHGNIKTFLGRIYFFVRLSDEFDFQTKL